MINSVLSNCIYKHKMALFANIQIDEFYNLIEFYYNSTDNYWNFSHRTLRNIMNDSTDLVHCDVAGFRGMMNDLDRKIYKLHEYKNGIMMFVNNENIIQIFEKINRSVSDPTYDPEDRLTRQFQLTYHYHQLLAIRKNHAYLLIGAFLQS